MIDKGTFESLKGYKRMQSPNMTIFDSGYIVGNKGKIVNEKMYHVVFSCLFRDMDIWKPIVLEILNSMKDLTKKDI